MKKNLLMAILMVIIGSGFCLHGINEGSQQKMRPTKRVSKTKKLADLTVKLEVKAKKYNKNYSVTPRYIVTNRGTAVARNFKVVLYHLYRSSSKARVRSVWWCSNTVSSLGVSQSWTFDYNPINTTGWYAEKGGQVGFKVVADHDKQVWESKEDNNTAWKW